MAEVTKVPYIGANAPNFSVTGFHASVTTKAGPNARNAGSSQIIRVVSCCIFANRSSTPMKLCCRISCALLLSLSALAQSPQSMAPQVVKFASGKLRLNGYLWKPAGTGPFPAVLFNHGSGGADADHTAGMPITQAANGLAPFFR